MDREGLLNTLKKASANTYDIYSELYARYFEKGDEPVEALSLILEYPYNIGDIEDETPREIKRQDENRITYVLEDLVCGVADRIAEMNYTKDIFYQKLYDAVFCSENELFPQSREEKVIALKILSEKAIAVPYFQIERVEEFSQNEFEETIEKLHPEIQEAVSMIQRRFDTMPELVMQLLRIEDTISEKRERALFWSIVINKFRDNDKE